MASTAAKTFNIPERTELILNNIDGDHGAEALFALQRVNSVFKDTIKSSNLLQGRMGLRHTEDALTTTLPDPSAVEVWWRQSKKLDLHPMRFVCATTSRTKDTGNPKAKLEFHYTPEEGSKPLLGFVGNTRIHTEKSSSWRHIKLFKAPIPVTVVVMVKRVLTREEKERCGLLNDPNSSLFYQQRKSMEQEDATLGSLVDVLEDVASRIMNDHLRQSAIGAGLRLNSQC